MRGAIVAKLQAAAHGGQGAEDARQKAKLRFRNYCYHEYQPRQRQTISKAKRIPHSSSGKGAPVKCITTWRTNDTRTAAASRDVGGTSKTPAQANLCDAGAAHSNIQNGKQWLCGGLAPQLPNCAPCAKIAPSGLRLPTALAGTQEAAGPQAHCYQGADGLLAAAPTLELVQGGVSEVASGGQGATDVTLNYFNCLGAVRANLALQLHIIDQQVSLVRRLLTPEQLAKATTASSGCYCQPPPSVPEAAKHEPLSADLLAAAGLNAGVVCLPLDADLVPGVTDDGLPMAPPPLGAEGARLTLAGTTVVGTTAYNKNPPVSVTSAAASQYPSAAASQYISGGRPRTDSNASTAVGSPAALGSPAELQATPEYHMPSPHSNAGVEIPKDVSMWCTSMTVCDRTAVLPTEELQAGRGAAWNDITQPHCLSSAWG